MVSRSLGASPRAGYTTSRQRLTAVKKRDARADAHFVYAVSTTGVYCRPSCGARQPLVHNIAYFETADAAEAAGYRACKRCQPRGPSKADQHAELASAACRLIDGRSEPPTLDEAARSLGVSKYHLHRVFKAVVGMNFRQYLGARRLVSVQASLARGNSVTRALYAAGYSSSSRFYSESPALGMPPASLRGAGQGQVIRSVVLKSSLGSVLVGTTARGICWVSLGSTAKALVRALHQRFHKASFAPADAQCSLLAREVVRVIDNGSERARLPLDLLGTSFQLRVWHALCKTSAGATTSYGELARSLGLPGAARAVGTACGENPVAVLVPCHRVIKKDGGLGGYRWGLARKRALLAQERSLKGS